jgi:chemotaxis protein methyltransferase CheR
MAIEPDEFEFVRALAHAEAGLVLETGKEYLVDSRLQPVARQAGFPSVHALVAAIRPSGQRELRARVVEALTTNETTFFRDVEPFELLRASVIPELVEKRKAERRLRIWYAATSTGQEPYSVSMLLREHFPALATWTIDQYATDLSSRVLTRAREGRYGQLEVKRGLPVGYFTKYFQQDGSEWRLSEAIRSMVRFDQLNLVKAWPALPPVDIVMMRNVLIYFDVQTKKQILGKVRRILRPDGYLFLGGAETTLNLDESFVRHQVNRSSCYRLAAAAAAAAHQRP